MSSFSDEYLDINELKNGHLDVNDSNTILKNDSTRYSDEDDEVIVLFYWF